MSDITNSSYLRYGFDLDRACFIDIAMNAQLILSLVNTFVCHPFPLFILLRKSPPMTTNVRRGYVAMHISYIAYEIIFFFLARIYVPLPYSGIYCEGPLCRTNLPNGALLGIMCFAIVLIQHPYAFLIISMHQKFIPDDSPFKLSKRTKYVIAAVQLVLLPLNIISFSFFGKEPDDVDELLKEPELVFLSNRGRLILFGGPGDPQYFRYAIIYFFFSLSVNFPVLVFFILHSMHILKKSGTITKCTQTQKLTKTMVEVFFWQLNCITLNHVIPLTTMMVLLFVDARGIPPHVLAVIKLMIIILFTLNSTQFCLLTHYLLSIFRCIRNSKPTPLEVSPRRIMVAAVTVSETGL